MSLILERHRYMITRIADAFHYSDENEIEKMMLEPEVIQSIDYFFKASGPTKIIITLESPEVNAKNSTPNNSKSNGSRTADANNSENVRLKVTFRELDYLPNTAIFFMKTRRGKEKDDKIAIDPYKLNDGSLTFGIIRSPLESLEAVLRCVYKPMIQEMASDTWGSASAEQKSELLTSVDNFTKGLQESIRSITGGLELKKPDERVESQGASVAGDPALVTDSLNLLQQWCTKIELYLDDSDRSRWETIDSGPDTELDYWRSRMQR